MHVLVTGGRHYEDDEKVFIVLDLVNSFRRITRIIHGKATGADSFAEDWALAARVKEIGKQPNWGLYGNYAGNVRNQRMLDENRVDLVVAFPGNSGTRDMIERAQKAQIRVIRIK